MAWISLVCLLALTSSAFGGLAYGGSYGSVPTQQPSRLLSIMRDQSIQRPFAPVLSQGYGQQQQQQLLNQRPLSIVQQQQDMPLMQKHLQSNYGSALVSPMQFIRTLPTQTYGQGYGAIPLVRQFDQPLVQQQTIVQTVTQADVICQGQVAETIIPLENGRRFVVCLDNGKGVEQECPKGLLYHTGTQRCERKLGALDNPCATQPCLNGGQCVPTDTTYQCQCASGFDGETCELDARTCQTQQPCGQAPDTRCQSFRLGAALQYICILQDGLAYGLSAQQAVPSPCQNVDGAQALAVSNGGFIMCDGDRMFIESCPGGTIWDDLEKACSWPDKQTVPQSDQEIIFGQSSYGQQQRMIPKSNYGNQITLSQQFEQPRLVQSYGVQMPISRQFEQPKEIESYGTQRTFPQQVERPRHVHSFGGQMINSRQFEQPKPMDSYGAQLTFPQHVERPKPIESFGSQMINSRQFEQPKPTVSYGAQQNFPQQFEQSKLVQSHQVPLHIPKQLSSYGAQMQIPQQLEQPKQISSYNAQVLLPQQPEQMNFVSDRHDDLVSVKQSSGY